MMPDGRGPKSTGGVNRPKQNSGAGSGILPPSTSRMWIGRKGPASGRNPRRYPVVADVQSAAVINGYPAPIQTLATGKKVMTTATKFENDASIIEEIENHAEQTRHLVNKVFRYAEQALSNPLPEGHAPNSTVTDPLKWAEEAQTDLQKGFMCLVRSVARPSTF